MSGDMQQFIGIVGQYWYVLAAIIVITIAGIIIKQLLKYVLMLIVLYAGWLYMKYDNANTVKDVLVKDANVIKNAATNKMKEKAGEATKKIVDNVKGKVGDEVEKQIKKDLFK
jgi:hypothetical protein